MFRSIITLLFCLSLIIPATAISDDRLSHLNETVQDRSKLQPGLTNYQVTVETNRVVEMIDQMTANMPKDIPRPKGPTITKYWKRGAERSLIVTQSAQSSPYVKQMVERFAKSLAVELDTLLMPPAKAEQRTALYKKAIVKTADADLAQSILHRVELVFPEPTDLDGAFYEEGIRLPQKQVKSLTFDIDAETRTITEMSIQAGDGPVLTVELRYLAVPGGNLPERIKITSPDGRVDDNFEVTFTEVDGFLLPAEMNRTVRRPDLRDDLNVFFKGYKINQSLPVEVESRFTQGQ